MQSIAKLFSRKIIQLRTRKGPGYLGSRGTIAEFRKMKTWIRGGALSYQVGVELIKRPYGECVYFVIHGEAAALSTPSKRPFDDDLIPVLNLDSARHFERTLAVGQ